MIPLQLNLGVIQQLLTTSVLFFIALQASPQPAHPDYGEIDGAFVSCWVNEPTADLAERAARANVESASWHSLDLDECRPVSREEYLDKPESLELFDQATIDGLVLTFHTWPIGGDDEL